MSVRSLLSLLAPPLCAGCGATAGAAEPLCGGCRRELRWLGPDPAEVAAGLLAWAPLAYEGPARGVVRALKFKGARGAAHAMAAQIVANAPPGWLDPHAVLVPAPLHPKRARTRGYNQALLLADAIAERAGLELRDCLERAGSTRTQVGRDRRERLGGIAGAIRLRSPPPDTALLVDDVITTGATLAACAEALGSPGRGEALGSSARAIAYARTPGR